MREERAYNVVVTGVGGQGVLTLSYLIGAAAMEEGFDVRVGEIHGMAQRGGVVVTHVRFGHEILSPTINPGEADVILGLEPAETVRVLSYANERTLVVMNSQPIVPPTAYVAGERYPTFHEIIDEVRKFTRRILTLNAYAIATEIGLPVAQNIVVLGALAATRCLPLKRETLEAVIKKYVPPRYVAANLEAFRRGYERAVDELTLHPLP